MLNHARFSVSPCPRSLIHSSTAGVAYPLRLKELVGRSSRISRSSHQAARLALGIRDARPRCAPSRGSPGITARHVVRRKARNGITTTFTLGNLSGHSGASPYLFSWHDWRCKTAPNASGEARCNPVSEPIVDYWIDSRLGPGYILILAE
jgi:hypothetical protein